MEPSDESKPVVILIVEDEIMTSDLVQDAVTTLGPALDKTASAASKLFEAIIYDTRTRRMADDAHTVSPSCNRVPNI